MLGGIGSCKVVSFLSALLLNSDAGWFWILSGEVPVLPGGFW
jgi:hypothetical protein